MEKDFIEELSWRGMLHDSTPEVAEHLGLAMRSGYIGFDPTADSLHVGNLKTLRIQPTSTTLLLSLLSWMGMEIFPKLEAIVFFESAEGVPVLVNILAHPLQCQ